MERFTPEDVLDDLIRIYGTGHEIRVTINDNVVTTKITVEPKDPATEEHPCNSVTEKFTYKFDEDDDLDTVIIHLEDGIDRFFMAVGVCY